MTAEKAAAETASNVKPFKSPNALAVQTTLAYDLGGNRQVSFATYFSQEETLEEQRALLTRLADLGDGLRLRYDLRVMRKELAQHQKTLKSGEEDLKRIDARAAEQWEARMKSLASEIIEADERAKAQWKARNKNTEYRREGGAKTHLERLEGELQDMKQRGFKLSQKDQAERDNSEVTLGKHRERIAEIEAEIEEAEAKLGASD